MKIAFIGAGYMGYGMAENLIKAGHALRVLVHRNRAGIERLVAQGAIETRRMDELLSGVEAIVSCVGTAEQIESVVKQAESHLPGGALWIDCTTSRPETAVAISNQLEAKDIHFMDAPVTRGPRDAVAGNLISFVGAEKEAFERAKPLLECYCEAVFYLGPVGSGLRVKLINNFITMGQVALVVEAMKAADHAGIDRRMLFEIISLGAARSGTLLKMVPPALEGDYSGHTFSLENAAKDVRYGRGLLAGRPAGLLLHETLNRYYTDLLKCHDPQTLLSELLKPD